MQITRVGFAESSLTAFKKIARVILRQGDTER
jgi:hypothetical protein